MIKINPYFLLMMSCMIFLTGCTSQRIVDKIQVIQGIGYDVVDDKIKGTVIYPIFEEKGKSRLKIYETESNSYHDILPRLNSKSAFPIEIGQLRMILFGSTFAKRGIDKVLYSYSRDPVAGSRIQIGVAEHLADDFLLRSKEENVPFHLSNKIVHNIQKGNLPATNLHVFLARLYAEGMDPYLPYFIMEKNQIKIDGLALFRKGKFIRPISLRQSFILKTLLDGAKNASYQIDIKNKGVMQLKNLSAKVHFTIVQTDPIPKIAIDLTMDTEIKDVPPGTLLTGTKNLRDLEKLIGKHFNDDIRNLISLFQKHRTDPLGLGDLVRTKSRNWDYKRFQDEIYPQLKTEVNTKVNIIQTGAGE
ncbi:MULTISPECIES: Ger(x)C family spore germination protein [Paenibacillus]|uniref:Germination protein GerC n=1 Tax=Paenibacillus naphthalenovorans TaxID=162209 RepID=A0A0U2L5G2_9BACL|nr:MULTISPECIES: Ger(x)C family spore germination protein [Paenibacillus]ALS25234.1 germination protein GerC [Paenibacillus naphthalenovorans]SDI31850.1 germination protein, Ger(x)C family [Paenibacillus naphthalenovorans]